MNMPNTAEHWSQGEHNEAFYQGIDKDVYSDWAATALFYSALHYIDAFLAGIGIDPGGHDDRDSEVANRKELRPLARQYFRLKNRSRDARYNCGKFHPQELQRSFGNDLSYIRNYLLQRARPKTT
jgi:hypothetical protein